MTTADEGLAVRVRGLTKRYGTTAAVDGIDLDVFRTGIEVCQFFRERESLIFIFAFPVILLAIFGAVFDNEIAPGVSFTQYFVAGMIASGIIVTSSQSLAISIAIERDDGTLKRLRGTPMPPRPTSCARSGWSW